MSAQFFELIFWQALVANVVGVLVAIALAYLVDWRVRRHQRKSRHRDVLSGLAVAIEHNQELVRQMELEIHKSGGYNYPTFNVDPWSVEVLVPELLQTSRDAKFVTRVNNYRYQLDHMARKIDALFRLMSQMPPGADHRAAQPLRESISAHTGPLRAEGETLLTEIRPQ